MQNRSSFLSGLIVSLLLTQTSAKAVQVYTSTPTIYESAGGNGAGWFYTGTVNNGSSGVYLGKYNNSYYVLTANHVGGGSFTLGSSTYAMVSGSYNQVQSGLDLGVFAIAGNSSLDVLTNLVLGSTLFTNTNLNMIGYGGGTKRGGYNTPDQYVQAGSPGYSQMTFVTDYDFIEGQAQGIIGDSGGGVFKQNGVNLELAGIMIGVQNISGIDYTYSVDVASYRTQILSRVPEASTTAFWIVTSLFIVGYCVNKKRTRRLS